MADLDQNYNDWFDQWYLYGVSKLAGDKIPVLPTTAGYIAESVGYDGAVSDNINMFLPAYWMMEGLGLCLREVRLNFYQDATDQVIFSDPSVSKLGRSAALVDRVVFINFLKNKGFISVWAVAGERRKLYCIHS